MKLRNWSFGIRGRLKKMMKCVWSGKGVREEESVPSSESLATRDYSAATRENSAAIRDNSGSVYSSRPGDNVDMTNDSSNIEEAESTLRESGHLNYEEARALLGRLEFQKGNVEAALHVFEGIDVAAVTSKIKFSLSRRFGQNQHHLQSDAPLMSMHAVSLLLEAIFLKALSLKRIQMFGEAADSCKIILDIVQSALPEGLPENFCRDCKLPEFLNKAVELLPELSKLAGDPQGTITSYRRALLYRWNLDTETKSKIEKEFAVMLLYSGTVASPPNLGSQVEGSFVPRNNIEEAVLLLLILLRKIVLKRIKWDPSILDHLSFALSVSGEARGLAHQVEELLPGIMGKKERYFTLALCYYAEGEDIVALNLLRNLLKNRENPDCILELMLASKICGENMTCIEEGKYWARKARSEFSDRCRQMLSKAHCLLGILFSAECRLVSSDLEMLSKQSQALEALETAKRMMEERDPYVIFHLCLENAEQRKLDAALYYAKQLMKLEAGYSVRGYILLARILSAQKRFIDAEGVINAALDQTGKWNQGELLRTKAKLQIAQGQLKDAIETYTHLLAVIQVQNKSFGSGKRLLKSQENKIRNLEMETWHDLANVYTSMSQWRDAEVCLSKSKSISPYSASRLHSKGLLKEAKGLHREALNSYKKALEVEPAHVPSLIATACILRKLDKKSVPTARSFLTEALKHDRMNPSAWHNLGLLYKDDNDAVSAAEAAECFQAAAHFQECAPVEPFRGAP